MNIVAEYWDRFQSHLFPYLECEKQKEILYLLTERIWNSTTLKEPNFMILMVAILMKNASID